MGRAGRSVSRPQLETDPTLLQPKAQQSLAKYHHELVVGNILRTRKQYVALFHADGHVEHVTLTDVQAAADVEIEQVFVGKLAQMHAEAVAAATAPRSA